MFLSNPQCESLTFDLVTPRERDISSILFYVRTAVLGDRSDLWRVEPFDSTRPLSFTLFPRTSISVAEAWDLCYSLRELPEVAAAEPDFELYLDAAPEDYDLDELPEPIQSTLRRDLEGLDESEIGRDYREEGLSQWDPDCIEWSPRLIRAYQAWEVPPRPKTGKARGEGIWIAHPDSGYRPHYDLLKYCGSGRRDWDRIRVDRDWDFIEGDDNAETSDGNHGVGTASVMMSRVDPRDPQDIDGVAPAATLVPYRVAKNGVLPTPVLLWGGMRRLAKSIERAMTLQHCHVISISLGGFWHGRVRRAITSAVLKRNIIVCAAAGNYVRIVIWPARYKEVIAVAGCTVQSTKWRGSSRGRAVDFTAPAKVVWKAGFDEHDGQIPKQSSGTSFSCASTAGAAALWLAKWGRSYLTGLKVGKVYPLSSIFRYIVKTTSESIPGNRGKFGSGILNCEELLKKRIPTVAEMNRSTELSFDDLRVETGPEEERGIGFLLDVFEDTPEEVVREKLAELMGLGIGDLDEQVDGVSEELAFHILSNPALRENFMAEADDDGLTVGMLREGLLVTGGTVGEPSLRELIEDIEVSSRLAGRL